MFGYEIDFINLTCQVAIFVFGFSAVFLLMFNRQKWGSVLGLISQPFWFLSSYHNSQWGIFALSVPYLFMWLYGVWEHWFKKAGKAQISPELREHIEQIVQRIQTTPDHSLPIYLNGNFTLRDISLIFEKIDEWYKTANLPEPTFQSFESNLIVTLPPQSVS